MADSELQLSFPAGAHAGLVSALLLAPRPARHLMVLAHGAGAGMRHPFMAALAQALADRGVASLRYQFPYMEQRSGRPDPQPVLLATVREAVAAAGRAAPGLALIAGGKSMGGRMTTLAAAAEPLPAVRGIALLGFPLHPAGSPGTSRAQHLTSVPVPMLFLQGTRDALANLELLRPILQGLGERATLKAIEGADHSFHVLKRSGTTDPAVLALLAESVAVWADRLK